MKDEEEALIHCPSLSWKTRLYGFGICFGIGVVLSIIATILLFTTQSPANFAVPYCFAAVISLFATGFLMGPINQCKKMFDKTRILATIVYLVSILATLLVAFLSGNGGLVLICIIIQCLALFWYALSYIPYGRQALTSCCGAVVST